MALVIYAEAVNSGVLHEFSWLAGQQKPDINRFGEHLIIRIEADGEEALYIKAEFSNVPYRYSALHRQIWKGELAQFLYDNL